MAREVLYRFLNWLAGPSEMKWITCSDFEYFDLRILSDFENTVVPRRTKQSVPTARSFYEMFVPQNMIFHRLVRQGIASRLDCKMVKWQEIKKCVLENAKESIKK